MYINLHLSFTVYDCNEEETLLIWMIFMGFFKWSVLHLLFFIVIFFITVLPQFLHQSYNSWPCNIMINVAICLLKVLKKNPKKQNLILWIFNHMENFNLTFLKLELLHSLFNDIHVTGKFKSLFTYHTRLKWNQNRKALPCAHCTFTLLKQKRFILQMWIKLISNQHNC